MGMFAHSNAWVVGAGVFVALATGCPRAPTGDQDDAESEGDAAWFELGWGVTEFNALAPGDELGVVWGTQGAAMFPLPVRGGEFVLPDPPDDFESPLAPKLDLHVDIEGHDDGIGGHFLYLANYPITFEIQPDGSYEFLFVAAVLPDGLDPLTLEGLPVHLWAQLQPYEAEPMEIELDLVVKNGEAPN
ncbi:MAG TPA: hypothetical protein VFG69_08620 [Nannocystaceae bacterium]|nr:hypothetical protein [Nannocystaceae bacterium]